MPQDCFKCLRKRRRDRVHFRLQRQGGGSQKKGSSPHQHLVQGDQKFPKITVEEPLEDLESENIEIWQKLQQEKTNESVTCRFCQGSVELEENVRTWVHLDVSVPER